MTGQPCLEELGGSSDVAVLRAEHVDDLAVLTASYTYCRAPATLT
jgi:hypothetical protein|tara:strand:- start:394 stop:528 length:135 start_codon:yes stop_codon:yes gene_type:complete